MMGLSDSEILFWIGVAVMAIVAIGATISIIFFTFSGRSLKERLEREYGKPWNEQM